MNTLWIIIISQSLIFGFFSSFIANEKNRDSFGWFLLGFVFSFLAVLALVAVPAKEKIPIAKKSLDSKKAKCPFCKEEIQADAVICKHCRSDLSETKPINIPDTKEPNISKKKEHDQIKELVCPKCKFTEHVPSNESFQEFKSHQGFSWEQSCLICPKCRKKIYNYPI